jgi:hypothetical protein
VAGFSRLKTQEAPNSKTLQLQCLRSLQPRFFFLTKDKQTAETDAAVQKETVVHVVVVQ